MKRLILICLIILTLGFSVTTCAPVEELFPVETATPTHTPEPTPTPRPEVNVALGKPVRVSASWVVDPPERAVDGNLNNWWGAGGPAPQWIEVDLGGLYSISRIKVINQGPTGNVSYRVFGRGSDRTNQLLYTFSGNKSENQTLEFSPATPWQDIATIRIEIPGGNGWVGFREIQIFSREDPKPLLVAGQASEPLFLAQVDPDSLEPIVAENAIFMEQVAMLGRGAISQLIWSPDGNMLAAAGPVGLWLYNPSDMQESPRLLDGHAREVLGVVFSSDGKTVLSASQDGTVKRWQVATGNLERTISLWDDFSFEVGDQKRESEVWSVAFSSDGERLVSGRLDGSLQVWNLASGQLETTLTGHTNLVNLLAFNPDGTMLASASLDGAMIVWDMKTGKQVATLSSSGQLYGLLFSPDGTMLLYGGPGMSTSMWFTVAGAPVIELKGSKDVLSLAFSPDGKTLASGSLDRAIRFLSYDTGESALFKDSAGLVTEVAFSPDGSSLAAYGFDGTLRVWNVASGEQVAGETTHSNPANSVAFNPQGTLLAVGYNDGTARLWDVKTNRVHSTLAGHTGGVTGVAFSPDGKLLASSSFDRTVSLWNGETGMPLDILQGHSSYVRCVAFSPDGRLIASGSTDTTVRLWDVETGVERFVLTGHAGEVESVAFSPDGTWLASASADNTVKLWDVETGKLIGDLKGHQSFALSVAFGLDRHTLVSGGGDHWLRASNLGETLGVVTGLNRFPAIGHPGWVTSVTFSPDGALIASANVSTTSYYVAPGEIHLYSADTGFPYALLRGHTKRITSVAFSPDGRLLASASADGSVRLWGVWDDGEDQTSQLIDATPTPQATDDTSQVTWQDDFNGSLADGWRWVGENPAKWNLTENPGFLRLYASHDFENSKNQIVRTPPDGNFVITTHVLFDPKANFQFAGLLIYQDDNNFLALGHAFCDLPNTCVGNGIYFDNVQAGNWVGGNFANSMGTQKDSYLRLEYKGDRVTAFISYDGATWFEIGTHVVSPNFRIKGIGLDATGDYDRTRPDVPADFEFFEVSEMH